MLEALKIVKSVKFIKIKGPMEAQPPLGFDKKISRGGQDLADLKICPRVAQGGTLTLGIDCYILKFFSCSAS